MTPALRTIGAVTFALAGALACSDDGVSAGDAAVLVDGGADADGPGSDLSADRLADAPADAAGPDGGDADDAPDDTPDGATAPLTAARSFNVEVTYVYTPALREYIQKHALNVPERQRAVVRVDPDELTVAIGFRGALARTGLTRLVDPVGGTRFAITAPAGVGNPLLPLDCGSTAFWKLSFSATDHEFHGEGEGNLMIPGDAQSHPFLIKMMLVGVPDTVGPELDLALSRYDPLNAVNLFTTEPLPAGTTARLVAADKTVDLMPIEWTAWKALVGWQLPMWGQLANDTEYRLEVAGWKDLEGNAGVTIAPLRTAAAPAIWVEDGFETAGGPTGGAQVLEAPALPPISGARSALVSNRSPGNRFSVRLPIAPGDTVVRAALREVASLGGNRPGPPVRLLVPGKPAIQVYSPQDPTNTRAPDGARFPWLGPTRVLELALPPGASEAIFDLEFPAPLFCSFEGPHFGYQIDDLRAE